MSSDYSDGMARDLDRWDQVAMDDPSHDVQDEVAEEEERAEREAEDAQQRAIEEHETWLLTDGADLLFGGE